jgi:hypothetical protein
VTLRVEDGVRVVVVPSATGAADRALRQTVASVLSTSAASATASTLCVCVVSNDVALVRLVRRTPVYLCYITDCGLDAQQGWRASRAPFASRLTQACCCVTGGERGAPCRGPAAGGEQERRAAQPRAVVVLLARPARVLQPRQRLREAPQLETSHADRSKDVAVVWASCGARGGAGGR